MISCDLVQAPADWEHFIEKMLYKTYKYVTEIAPNLKAISS